jgi:putative transposase
MKKRKHTESEIFRILKEQDSGKTVQEICRANSITPATFYRWKSQYSGLELNQLKKLKSIEEELAQYKRMYSELARENFILKDVIEKKL